DAVARLTAILRTDLPVLVDADGLTILSEHQDLLPRRAPTLITPHAGELARLLGTDPASVEARRLEHARRAAPPLGRPRPPGAPGPRTRARHPHRPPVAGRRGQRRRAVRAGRRAARAGPGPRPGRPGGRLPARPGGQARGGRVPWPG